MCFPPLNSASLKGAQEATPLIGSVNQTGSLTIVPCFKLFLCDNPGGTPPLPFIEDLPRARPLTSHDLTSPSQKHLLNKVGRALYGSKRIMDGALRNQEMPGKWPVLPFKSNASFPSFSRILSDA